VRTHGHAPRVDGRGRPTGHLRRVARHAGAGAQTRARRCGVTTAPKESAFAGNGRAALPRFWMTWARSHVVRASGWSASTSKATSSPATWRGPRARGESEDPLLDGVRHEELFEERVRGRRRINPTPTTNKRKELAGKIFHEFAPKPPGVCSHSEHEACSGEGTRMATNPLRSQIYTGGRGKIFPPRE
jgi:hypothetical protein